METPSESCDSLILLTGAESFLKYFREICSTANKELCLLFDRIDPYLFNDTEATDCISTMARQQPKAQIRILIKNTRNIASQRCELLTLAQRLPSKIAVRTPRLEPKDEQVNYILGDRTTVLLRHDSETYKGFYNSQARAEAQNLQEEFNYLWERQSTDIPDLRTLRI